MKIRLMAGFLAGIMLLGITSWPFDIAIKTPGGNPEPESTVLSNLAPELPAVPRNIDSATVANVDQLTNQPQQQKSVYTPEAVKNNKIIANGREFPLLPYKPLAIPNDPQANQWWVNGAGVSQAWDTPRGPNPTVLAIIDTGFALNHEEFQNRWYTNQAEAGSATSEAASTLNCTDRSLAISQACNLIDDDYDGIVDDESGATTSQNPSRLNCTAQSKPLTKDCNRKDDDGNGLIDDVRGWDFINFDNSVQAGEVNPSGSGTHHASYVTSTAAATNNNGKGIAGVDGGTTILPIQALDDNGYGHSLSVARAIRYATAQHANVISMSLGGNIADDYLRQAIQEAVAAGVVLVAASGNDGCDCISYPANYPEVVSVGALGTNMQKASFSSYGANLDIMAPGYSMYTADWQPGNPASAYASGIAGTSLATPVVSGAMTRLLSFRPNLNSLELIAAITENSDRSGLGSAGFNNQLGFGYLNAGGATTRVLNPFNPVEMDVFNSVSSGSSLSLPLAQPSITAYQCINHPTGTTAIYSLAKGSRVFYSANPSEIFLAQQQGYTAEFFTYSCLKFPHDSPQLVRSLNILPEFKNIIPKTAF